MVKHIRLDFKTKDERLARLNALYYQLLLIVNKEK
jgi:hypothetical protein